MAGLFLIYGLAMLAGLYWAVRYAFGPLRGIVGAIAAFRKQDFSARLPRLPVRELDHIAGALNHLAEALAEAQARQKHLSLQMASLQEDERARLAIEVHEHFGQGLTALRANIAYLLRQTSETPRLQAAVRDMEVQTAGIHQEVRALLRRLQPDGGDTNGQEQLGLQILLHELVKSWQDADGNNTLYRLDVTSGRFAPASRNQPDRVSDDPGSPCQHCPARPCQKVDISVRIDPDEPSMLCWRVADDGVGIASPESAMSHGNGLAGIRERIWARGGSLQIGAASADSARPGLCLSVRLPAVTRHDCT
jgi:two-component system sensor histidine kinase UhpB